MTNRMIKNTEYLKLLKNCTPQQRTAILKTAHPELVHALCDCITNVIHKKVPVTVKQKKSLSSKKKVLRKLSHKRTGLKTKKRLLVQHGNGILTTILGTVLNALTSV